MVPKVSVPMDFGRHLLGSPTHNNLKINTSEGGEVMANSVILSFNSPVIDHLTTTLHLTSVDMLDFSEDAVRTFVDAAYSGTVEGISKEIFERDIEKIAHSFKITWLTEPGSECTAVNVPMDFGRSLLSSPVHNNLKINTSEEGEVMANSVILSFNSPVIDHMTTTLHLTSVDMLEFPEDVVRLFVDAAYFGIVEGITWEIFRDIAKMAYVFKMTWLSEKCLDYFAEVAHSLKVPSYEEILFLFEEAGFTFEQLKTKDYLLIIIKTIERLGWKQQFIDNYLEKAGRLSTKKLDMVIELTDTEVNCVVQTVTNQLSELIKVPGFCLPASSQYLLDNSKLHLCREVNRVVFEQLFDLLSGLPDEHMRWLFELHKKATSPAKTRVCNSAIVSRCNNIPNLYYSVDPFMKLNEILDWLSTSETVTSLLRALEAVWTWRMINLRYHQNNIRSHIDDIPAFSARLKDIANNRGWSLLPPKFSEYDLSLFSYMPWPHNWRSVSHWIDLSTLCLSAEENCPYVIIACVDMCKRPLNRVLRHYSELTFHFKHPSVTSCNLPGECGFIVKTVPSGAPLWTVRLCTKKEDYFDKGVHFHEEVRAENMHMFFRIVDGKHLKTHLYCLSWLGWIHLGPECEQRRINAELYDYYPRGDWEDGFDFHSTSRFEVLYHYNDSID